MNSLNRVQNHCNYKIIRVALLQQSLLLLNNKHLSTKTTNKEESHLQRGELIRKPYETFSESSLVRYKQRRRDELNILKQNDANNATPSSISTLSPMLGASSAIRQPIVNNGEKKLVDRVKATNSTNSNDNNFEVRNLLSLSKEEECSSIVFQQSATTVHRRSRALQRNNILQGIDDNDETNHKHINNKTARKSQEGSNSNAVTYFVGGTSLLSMCSAYLCIS